MLCVSEGAGGCEGAGKGREYPGGLEISQYEHIVGDDEDEDKGGESSTYTAASRSVEVTTSKTEKREYALLVTAGLAGGRSKERADSGRRRQTQSL